MPDGRSSRKNSRLYLLSFLPIVQPRYGPFSTRCARSGRVNLVETEAREVLRAYGFDLPSHGLAKSADEAVKLFSEMGGSKSVMKIVSPERLHKTDAGGVFLNVDSGEKSP